MYTVTEFQEVTNKVTETPVDLPRSPNVRLSYALSATSSRPTNSATVALRVGLASTWIKSASACGASTSLLVPVLYPTVPGRTAIVASPTSLL
jgi:hypothetical protein